MPQNALVFCVSLTLVYAVNANQKPQQKAYVCINKPRLACLSGMQIIPILTGQASWRTFSAAAVTYSEHINLASPSVCVCVMCAKQPITGK